MRKTIAAVIVSTVLIQGCSTMSDKPEMSDSEKIISYVGDSDSQHVLTAAGDCLRSTGWASENMMVECQASSKAAMTPEVVQEPKQLARLSFNGTALFAFDSAELSAEGRRELNDLVARLNGNTEVGSVAVVGHSDSIGDADYNQSLSEQRAATVRQYLTSSLSDVDVLSSGMGESAPVGDNATSVGRQQNRRVEVKINAVAEEGAKAVFN